MRVAQCASFCTGAAPGAGGFGAHDFRAEEPVGLEGEGLGDAGGEEVVAAVVAVNGGAAPDPVIGQFEAAAGDGGLEAGEECWGGGGTGVGCGGGEEEGAAVDHGDSISLWVGGGTRGSANCSWPAAGAGVRARFPRAGRARLIS